MIYRRLPPAQCCGAALQWVIPGEGGTKRSQSYQVVIRLDAEQIPEVAEGQRGVGLKAEVRVVMSWGQVASFTGLCNSAGQRVTKREQKIKWHIRFVIPELK